MGTLGVSVCRLIASAVTARFLCISSACSPASPRRLYLAPPLLLRVVLRFVCLPRERPGRCVVVGFSSPSPAAPHALQLTTVEFDLLDRRGNLPLHPVLPLNANNLQWVPVRQL